MRPEAMIGQVVDGRYRIERLIGRGGMGYVFACRHVVVGKPAAMKVLRLGPNQSDGVLARFVREAQTANAIRSRHIVEMSDFGQMEDGFFYVVMELLEGMSLTRAMREGRLSKADYLRVFLQMADALHLVHSQGIVHRDLKPDNVFLVHENGDPLFVKLLDFGIAKVVHAQNAGLTETGVVLGTPYYMSPEQARGDKVDHRADIYSFGVMMYRAFTGKLPFVAESMVGVLTRHVMEPPEPPSHFADVDAFTEQVILRCLAKSPAARFQTMAEVAAELRAIAMQYGLGAGSGMMATPLLMQQAQILEQAQRLAPSSSGYPVVAPASVAAPASLSLPPSALDFSSGLHARPTAPQSGQHPSVMPGQPLLPPSAFSATPPPGSIVAPRSSSSYPSGNYPAAGVPSSAYGTVPPPSSVPLMGELGTQRSVVTSHTGKYAIVPKRTSALSIALPIAVVVAGVVVAIAIVLSRGTSSAPTVAANTAASSAPAAPPSAEPADSAVAAALTASASNSVEMTAPSAEPSAEPAESASKQASRTPSANKTVPVAKPTTTHKPPPRQSEIRSPFE